MAFVPLKIKIPGSMVRTIGLDLNLTVLESEWDDLEVGNKVVSYLGVDGWVALNSPSEFFSLALRPWVTLGILGFESQILSKLMNYQDLTTHPDRHQCLSQYSRVVEKAVSTFVINLEAGFANEDAKEKTDVDKEQKKPEGIDVDLHNVEDTLKGGQNDKEVEEVVEHKEIVEGKAESAVE